MAITALTVAMQSFALQSTAPTLKDGFYVGIDGGVSHSQATLDHSHKSQKLKYNDHFRHTNNMPILGFIIGYGRRYYDNYFGVEMQGHGYSDNKNQQSVQFQGPPTTTDMSNFELDKSLSLLLVYGRYLSKRILLLTQAGITAAHINNTTTTTTTSHGKKSDPYVFYNQSSWLKGFKLGAGIQVALTSHISGRVMLDYNDYKQKQYTFNNKMSTNDHFRLQTQSLTAGLIYTF